MGSCLCISRNSAQIGYKTNGLESTLFFLSTIVLIKSNFPGILRFSLNCMKLPKNIYNDIDKTNRNFISENNMDISLDKKSIYITSWDKIVQNY